MGCRDSPERISQRTKKSIKKGEKMNFQSVEQADGKNVAMWATLTSWDGIAFTTNQAKYLTCKLIDDNGIEHKCRIYEGKGALPGQENLNKRLEFNLSCYQGSYQGSPYTGYSGFWSHGAAQTSQGSPQRPQQARQGTNAPQPDWDAKDLRMARMNALTNSTKLICLMAEVGKDIYLTTKDKVGLVNLITQTAEIVVHYIYNGLTKKQAPEQPQYQANPDYVGDNPPPPVDEEVPF